MLNGSSPAGLRKRRKHRCLRGSNVRIPLPILPRSRAPGLVCCPVGEDDTATGGLFSIQLNSRDYVLKAEDHQEAVEWVEVGRTEPKSAAPGAAV